MLVVPVLFHFQQGTTQPQPVVLDQGIRLKILEQAGGIGYRKLKFKRPDIIATLLRAII